MALSLLGLFRRARQNDRRRRGRFMSKAFCMIMLIGLGVAATPALAQGPKHNADKVRARMKRLNPDAGRPNIRNTNPARAPNRDATTSPKTNTAGRPEGNAARKKAWAAGKCLRGRQ